ncbi:hypothetical protein FNJ87_01335 [Nonlabens mediterrranea]|uniref:ATPase n=1 Tax=Nonlabens mediterrranea TaxID=1419947 RepID=A0ABS0A2B5_9FLAO|nr:hypothetical protein [Nonlabens mediterrranea]
MNRRDFNKYINGTAFKVGEMSQDNKIHLDFSLLLNYFEALGKSYNLKFFIDKNDITVFENLFNYYLKDEEYCTRKNIDPNKGLLLVGGNGVGKSTIIKMFAEFFISGKPKVYSMCDLSEKVSIDGIAALDIINYQRDFILDDVGSEMQSVYYGTRNEVFSSILMNFEQKNFPAYTPDENNFVTKLSSSDISSTRTNPKIHARIFASTNFTLQEFEDRYGKRVYSRMAEYFNIINFPTTIDKRIARANIIRD